MSISQALSTFLANNALFLLRRATSMGHLLVVLWKHPRHSKRYADIFQFCMSLLKSIIVHSMLPTSCCSPTPGRPVIIVIDHAITRNTNANTQNQIYSRFLSNERLTAATFLVCRRAINDTRLWVTRKVSHVSRKRAWEEEDAHAGGAAHFSTELRFGHVSTKRQFGHVSIKRR